jgi:hypothetical protein
MWTRFWSKLSNYYYPSRSSKLTIKLKFTLINIIFLSLMDLFYKNLYFLHCFNLNIWYTKKYTYKLSCLLLICSKFIVSLFLFSFSFMECYLQEYLLIFHLFFDDENSLGLIVIQFDMNFVMRILFLKMKHCHLKNLNLQSMFLN